MKESKNSLAGTGRVFAFTISGLMKNRGNIIAVVILLLAAVVCVPVLLTFGARGIFESQTRIPVDRIRYCVLADVSLTEEDLAGRDTAFEKTVFEETQMDEIHPGRLEPSEAGVCILAGEDNSFFVRVFTSEDTKLSRDDMTQIETLFTGALKDANYRQSGMNDRQMALVSATWQTSSEDLYSYMKQDTGNSDSAYSIQIVYSILVIMISAFAVGYIVRSVVEEKASKLVEMLLVNLKPLALITGKILASLLYVFGIFVLLIVCMLLSYAVSSRVMGIPGLWEFLSQAGKSLGVTNVGPGVLAAVLISLVLGCLMFAIIAGLSGSGCSSMEDISAASGVVTMLIMIGYFASIILVNLPSTTVELFSSICPVLSVYCAPIQFILGNISAGILVLSWALQAAVILLLMLFCAKIYRALLMYRGKRLTFSDMMAMFRGKTEKGGAK